MPSSSFVVPPRSWDRISQITDKLRAQLGLTDRPDFPIMTYLEKVLDAHDIVPLIVSTRVEMGMAEGYTCPDQTYIELRDDVYEAAWAGDGRARFTAAHELGHYILHTKIPLARASPLQEAKPFLLSEPQADQFAAELLMPRSFAAPNDTAHSIKARHEVSFLAAENRIRFFRKKGII